MRSWVCCHPSFGSTASAEGMLGLGDKEQLTVAGCHAAAGSTYCSRKAVASDRRRGCGCERAGGRSCHCKASDPTQRAQEQGRHRHCTSSCCCSCCCCSSARRPRRRPVGVRLVAVVIVTSPLGYAGRRRRCCPFRVPVVAERSRALLRHRRGCASPRRRSEAHAPAQQLPGREGARTQRALHCRRCPSSFSCQWLRPTATVRGGLEEGAGCRQGRDNAGAARPARYGARGTRGGRDAAQALHQQGGRRLRRAQARRRRRRDRSGSCRAVCCSEPRQRAPLGRRRPLLVRARPVQRPGLPPHYRKRGGPGSELWEVAEQARGRGPPRRVQWHRWRRRVELSRRGEARATRCTARRGDLGSGPPAGETGPLGRGAPQAGGSSDGIPCEPRRRGVRRGGRNSCGAIMVGERLAVDDCAPGGACLRLRRTSRDMRSVVGRGGPAAGYRGRGCPCAASRVVELRRRRGSGH